MKEKGKGRRSLAYQIFLFFILGLIITDVLSFFVIRWMVLTNVMNEKVEISQNVALDVDKSIKETASYEWVIDYMLSHKDDDWDLEYDKEDETLLKYDELSRKHPGLNIRSVTASELESFSDEDKKTYVEIVYNQWVTRLNNIKTSYNAEFLYILATDDEYKEDTFIISANGGNQTRGTEIGTAYIFGVEVTNNDIQKVAFKQLKDKENDSIFLGNYLDGYRYMFRIDDMNLITGMTFDVSSMQHAVMVHTIRFLIAFIILQIILVLVCRFLLFRNFIKPLKIIEKNVREYSKTKDADSAKKSLEKVDSDNEIGSLSDGVYEMICEIEDHLDEIRTVTAENERITVELDLAQKIQTDMLPSIFPPFPENTQFDIYANTDPAKEVGGDFYDFFMVDKTHVALVMADVSGKGVPASLFMVVAKTLIKNYALMGGSPAEVLDKVNTQLMDGNEEGMFVTVWMAVIDINTGKGLAANAGHEHPVIRHKDGSFELVKYKHSLAVAMMPGVPFEEHEIELKPGDRVFVYTDGLPEARNSDKEFFGTDRMLDVLNKDPYAKGQALLTAMINEMSSFVGNAEQFDDVTMLIFDYYGSDDKEN
ncbi:MAG: serine/threonine-protein phosphatase [Eubacterium sp.]|nr:serine/threonine-protein phosphatase [Eubacterium sp.]